jgi:hypothetical protein
MTTLADVGQVFLDGYLANTLEHHGVKGMKWGQHVAAGKTVSSKADTKPKVGKSAHLLTGKERAQFNKNHPNVKKGYLTNAQRALFYKNHPHAVVGKKIAPGAGKPGSHAESGGHHKPASSRSPKSGHTLGRGVHIKPPGGGKKSIIPGRNPKGGGSHAAPSHPDAAKHAQLNATVQQHGTKALSNEDLQTLVSRMKLLQQHQQLTTASSTPERGSAREIARSAAQQQVRSIVNQGASAASNAAVQHLIKQLAKKGAHHALS